MTTIENDPEVEILILSNLLIIVGGIGAAFGFLSLPWGGIVLALIGLVLFGLGCWWLVTAFRRYQWDDLKLLWLAAQAAAQERIEK